MQVSGVSCVYAGLDEPLAGRSKPTCTSLHPGDGDDRPEPGLCHERCVVLQIAQSRLPPHRHTKYQQVPLEGDSALFLPVKTQLTSVFYLCDLLKSVNYSILICNVCLYNKKKRLS